MVIVMNTRRLRDIIRYGHSLSQDTPASQLFNEAQRLQAHGRLLIDDADYPIPSPRECAERGLYQR